MGVHILEVCSCLFQPKSINWDSLFNFVILNIRIYNMPQAGTNIEPNIFLCKRNQIWTLKLIMSDLQGILIPPAIHVCLLYTFSILFLNKTSHYSI